MSDTITRQALYERVWSAPMTQLAAELRTTTAVLKSICDRAAIPTPPSGHWMKLQFGKAPQTPPLPAPPPGLNEPLIIAPAERKPRAKPDATPMGAAVEKSSERPTPGPPPAPAPRPTSPTVLTREALYDAVWQTPMSRLAPAYGVSGNGLAKICDRAGIPYPPRGYWAKAASGATMPKPALPPAPDRVSDRITIRPTPAPETPPELPNEVVALAERVRAQAGELHVAERLNRPHAIIAGWIADHEAKRRRARQERDPWMRGLAPAPFTDADRRRHRVLDALFKALERHGTKVRQDDRGSLFAEVNGEKIEFQMREKLKKGRRPLTDDERRWSSSGDKGWRQELLPTGCLVLTIKTYLPTGFRQEWLDTNAEPIEDLLPDIVATFIAAGPSLVERRKAREAAEAERQREEYRRYEEQRRRKLERNRWRRFTELAQDWRKQQIAAEFLAAMRGIETDPEAQVQGRPLAEWLTWAEQQLKDADPLAEGPAGVFAEVATVTDWTYRD